MLRSIDEPHGQCDSLLYEKNDILVHAPDGVGSNGMRAGHGAGQANRHQPQHRDPAGNIV